MTVPTTTRTVDWPGDGATVDFPFPFKAILDTHLVVSVIAASGAVTVLTLGTDYTVAGMGGPSGLVTVAVPPGLTDTVRIRRVVPLTQLTDLRNQGSFKPTSIEDALDLGIMAAQTVLDAQAVAVDPGWQSFSDPTGLLTGVTYGFMGSTQMSATDGIPFVAAGSIVGLACSAVVNPFASNGGLRATVEIDGIVQFFVDIPVQAAGTFRFSSGVLVAGLYPFLVNSYWAVKYQRTSGSFSVSNAKASIRAVYS